jgi:N-acetylmuramoyl-L-alanine amidase
MMKFRWWLAILFILPIAGFCQRLSPLGETPDWTRLDSFQETMSHDEFVDLLNSVYAPGGTAPWIIVEGDQAVIQKNATDRYQLRFASATGAGKPLVQDWSFDHLKPVKRQPLSGLRIALDPGHLGGAWAKMEERWFQIGTSTPVTEGDMTLKVAKLLELHLRALGAKVESVRPGPGPVNVFAPDHYQAEAIAALKDRGIAHPENSYTSQTDSNREKTVSWEQELLFYRVAEIRERARIVNERIKPDLTICLHFNAEPWGDPGHPGLVNLNHMHLLVNGAYSKAELGYDDVRFAMLIKLLSRTYEKELPVAESVAESLRTASGLPPYLYSTPNAKAVGKTGYVWARNLIANRLYECPVIYLEPYVMNNYEVFARVQAGEYEGLRNFGGVLRKNIYAEYADAVVAGLVQYFRAPKVH